MKGVWFSIALLVFALPVGAVSFFNISETQTISLAVNASDPDNDKLDIIYSFPLNQSGEWNPTYGDAGVYKTNITVSDGESFTVQEVLLVVSEKQESPSIDTISPAVDVVTLTEGESAIFRISGSDLNNDNLTYSWYLDDVLVSNNQDILFKTSYSDQGNHTVVGEISDGKLTTSRSWIVQVQDVDLDTIILDAFTDRTVVEGDRVSYELPDFDFYGLTYSLSEPLQDNNWRTNFFSAGEYQITLTVSGDGYEREHEFTVTVENQDRPPAFAPIGTQYTKERQEVAFTVSAVDPDNENVTITALELPAGATFENNEFRWTPEYSFVQGGGFIRALLHRFHLLTWRETALFQASSNNKTDELKVSIIVLNRNRAPSLDLPDYVEAREGEEFVLNVSGFDEDNDPLTYQYSGFVAPGEIVSYDMQGSYVLKVEASDGHASAVDYVTVKVFGDNRGPTVEEFSTQTVAENETLVVPIVSSDPDNDNLTYSLNQAPDGMEVIDGAVVWTPSFESTTASVISRFNIEVIGSDGSLSSNQWLAVEVSNVNQLPGTTLEEPIEFAATVNEPVLLQIPVVDADGDELTGKWVFSSRDHFDGLAHQRTFISKGEKKGTFVVSDGQDEVEIPFVVVVE